MIFAGSAPAPGAVFRAPRKTPCTRKLFRRQHPRRELKLDARRLQQRPEAGVLPNWKPGKQKKAVRVDGRDDFRKDYAVAAALVGAALAALAALTTAFLRFW